MRIISGKYGGRVIHPPKGLPVRPTTDRTREALMSILGSRMDLDGIRVLDGCAGTGAVGLELLSRGAASVTFVDQHPKCLAFIKRTTETLGATGARTERSELRRYLERAEGPFDLIFMDPPYAMPDKAGLVQTILGKGLLAADGLIILEHSDKEQFDALPGFSESRKYGGTVFSFFESESLSV